MALKLVRSTYFPKEFSIESPNRNTSLSNANSQYIALVETGIRQMIETDDEKMTVVPYDIDDEEVFSFGDWILMALATLKRTGYLSDTKAIFTVHQYRTFHEGVKYETMDHIVIAQEGRNEYFEVHFDLQYNIMYKKTLDSGKVIDIEWMQSVADKFETNDMIAKKEAFSHFTARMDLADFGGMIARLDRRRCVESDKREMIMATLMGTHKRLGAESLLNNLDVGILGMIIGNIVYPGMREAILEGLVRF